MKSAAACYTPWGKQRKLRRGPKQANARPARIGACIVPACRTPINGARSVPYNPPSSTELHRDPPSSTEIQRDPASSSRAQKPMLVGATCLPPSPKRPCHLGLEG